MNRRVYLVTAALLAVLALGAVVYAAGTKPDDLGGATAKGDGNTAPVVRAKGWLNTKPLTKVDLQHKVVMYDFWTYSCVNCVRTIPYVRSWYDRYHKDGLVIIGVHSPEFDFEKNHENVAKAVKKLGVDYPVALDDDMDIWNAFANQYWPAHYIYDRSGKQVSVHFGEGDYAKTENEIRKLLGVKASSPRATLTGHVAQASTDVDQTAETYNGSDRGQDGFASPESLILGTHDFTLPATLEPGEHALGGTWNVQPEYIESSGKASTLELRFEAGQANLVMSTASGKPIDVSVQVDDARPTTVKVDAADLYQLAEGVAAGPHTLKLTPSAPGLRAFAFTFGG